MNFLLNWTGWSSGVWDLWLQKKNVYFCCHSLKSLLACLQGTYMGELNSESDLGLLFSLFSFFFLLLLRVWITSGLTRKIMCGGPEQGLLGQHKYFCITLLSAVCKAGYSCYSSEPPFGILWHPLLTPALLCWLVRCWRMCVSCRQPCT